LDFASVDVALFQSEGSNMIQWIAPPAINSGGFTFRGIEVSGQAVFSDALSCETSYGYTNVGNLTRAMPQHKFFVGGNYKYLLTTFSLSAQNVSKIYGADDSKLRMPDYTLISAKISTTPMNNIRVFVSCENVLDKQYQIIYDYPMPGRTFFVGANVMF